MKILVGDLCKPSRLGIQSVLQQACISSEIDDAEDKDTLLEKAAITIYDIIVIDPTICRAEGLTLPARLKDTAPYSRVVIFTDLDELKFGPKLIKAGAKGYLMKTCTRDEFIRALLTVSSGKLYISDRLSEFSASRLYIKKKVVSHGLLTHREKQVFSMLVSGWRIKKIAVVLQLSVKTVSSHKGRILAKLDCDSLSALVQYAISQDLTADCLAEYELV